MADSYLIDGYNLIHALGLIDRPIVPHSLEQSRRRLLDFLKASFAESEAAHITIVFDAKRAPPRVARQQTVHGMHVQFAPKKQSADDLIETLIDEHPRPLRLIVISNDMRLQQAAQRRGARAWTDAALLDFLERRSTAAQPSESPADERQPDAMSDADKEHWRKEFEGLEHDPELKEFFEIDRFED